MVRYNTLNIKLKKKNNHENETVRRIVAGVGTSSSGTRKGFGEEVTFVPRLERHWWDHGGSMPQAEGTADARPRAGNELDGSKEEKGDTEGLG